MPTPGHEVYGYVPYWEMDASIAGHLAQTDLTTLALFSVTNKRNGTLDTAQNGYKRIAGPIGQQLIAEAHARGTGSSSCSPASGWTRTSACSAARSRPRTR